MLLNLLEQLYAGEELTNDRALLRQTARDYMEALQEGYNGRLTDVDWNSPDFDTIQHLTENVYQFAAAKNYHELKDLTAAIADGDRLRSFSEFEEEARRIVGKYNGAWLRTEYNQAVAAAQSGARWNEFARHKQAMPYLQYQCVMDENTRADHAALNGIIKRIDDEFWDRYMPPNGWGCRCEAIQLPGSGYEETKDENIHPPFVPEMFQVNFGKQGIAFPVSHAYFRNMPRNVWRGLEPQVRMEVLRYYQDLALASMPSTGNDLVEFSNLQTGKLKRSSKIRERLVNPRHARTVEETKAAQYIWNNPDKLEFERISTFGEGKDISNAHDINNLNGKTRRKVEEYLQYKFEYKGVEYHIKLERIEDGLEQFYSLTKP